MAQLVILGTDIFYPVTDQPIVIGRSSQCDITIHDDRSSRKHCRIEKDEAYTLQDLGSYNGTYVNGKKIHRHVLEPEDQITIGKTVFIFRLDTPESLKEKATSPVLVVEAKRRATRVVPLIPGSYCLGRSERSDICLPSTQVSSSHATIFWKDRQWWLKDLHSKNGTFLNHEKIDVAPVRIGDVIQLGDARCTIRPPGFYIRPSPMRKLPFVAGVVAILLIVVGALWLKQWHSPRYEFDGDNLIEDFSFENVDHWHLGGGMQITQSAAKTGRSSLFFALSSGKSNEACYHEMFAVDPRSVYQVSAWANFKGLRGLAGLKIAWLGKSPAITESYSPLLTGDSSQWQKIEFIACPPPHAETMQVYCVAFGSAEYLYLDDIALLARDEAPLSLKLGEAQVFLDHSGNGKLYSGKELLLEIGKMDPSRTGWIATGKIGREEDRLVWEGTFYRSRDFEPIGTASIRCTKNADSLQVESEGIPSDIAALTIPADLKVRLGNGSFNSYLQELSGQNFLEYAVWEGRQFGLFFSRPALFRVRRTQDGFSLQPVTAPPSWTVRFLGDMSEASELQERARKHEEQKRPGLAAQAYRSIASDFRYHSDAPRAITGVYRLEREFRRELAGVLQMAQRANFFQNIAAHTQVIQVVPALQVKWEGMPGVEKLAELADNAARERESILAEAREVSSQRLWRRACDLAKDDHLALAWMFYREIQENYPGTKAGEDASGKIAEIVKKLPKILK